MNTVKTIDLSQLEIPDFQRGVKPSHPIKGKYDERLEGAGTVALYAGKYFLLDGLQRKTYKEKAISDGASNLTPSMWFVVLNDLSFSEMAEVFIRINKARAGMAAYDLFKAGVSAGLSAPTKFRDIAKQAGLTVAPLKREDGTNLTVISPLITAIERGREDDVREALRVLTVAFPTTTIDNRVIVGYLEYLQNCRNDGGRSARVANEDYIVTTLQRKFKSMSGLRSAGLQRAAEGNTSEYSGVAKALRVGLGSTRASRARNKKNDEEE